MLKMRDSTFRFAISFKGIRKQGKMRNAGEDEGDGEAGEAGEAGEDEGDGEVNSKRLPVPCSLFPVP